MMTLFKALRTQSLGRPNAIPPQFAEQRAELEQCVLRVIIGGLVLGYLSWFASTAGATAHPVSEVLSVAVIFFLFSVGLATVVLSSRHISVGRRVLGIVADNAVTSYCLLRMGEGGAVILGVYLFVAFGNGFRYGRLYLHFSQVTGLIGFSVVLALSPFWSSHLSIGIGFLLSMIVLPFYVGVLAERINEARKKADDANNAKGRFLANVSHEMRTPLNGVIAMADLLRETQLNESQYEIVDTLGTSAYLLLGQIEDVLDMAKIEAGRIHIERQPFDLGQLLSSTVKVVLPHARFKQLNMRTEIAPEATRWFEGDAHHLRQVLLNLLANAVKFTETGEVTLRVTVKDSHSNGPTVRFEIQDTGIGIPEGKQASIFEPFTQADDSITRIYGGTGLGTTIARQLVELMNGEIGLDSTVGIGSVFWFQLPLIACQSTNPCEKVGPQIPIARSPTVAMTQRQCNISRLRGAQILVAEDNLTNQRVTRMVLESAGHRVTVVSDGEAALDALEQGGFDLALFDLSMPLVSGLEALKLYQFAAAKPIPVLILSANVTPDVIAECQQAGAAEFIPKPMRPRVLLDAIEAHVPNIVDEGRESPNPRKEEKPTLFVVDTPPVDVTVLKDLARISDDASFVDRLVCSFRLDTERLVEVIFEALAARKFEEVKDAAHALKGGAGSVGATHLFQLASRLQDLTHDALRLKTSSISEELIRTTEATLAFLENHLEERRRHLFHW